MTWVIWITCTATAKNDILKSHHKITPIFWTKLKFSTNSVCSSFKIKLFLTRHAAAQHNKLIQQLFFFFPLKYPNAVSKSFSKAPFSQCSHKKPDCLISEGQTIFLPLSSVELQQEWCFCSSEPQNSEMLIEQDGSQDSIVSKMTHCRLDGTEIESR